VENGLRGRCQQGITQKSQQKRRIGKVPENRSEKKKRPTKGKREGDEKAKGHNANKKQ